MSMVFFVLRLPHGPWQQEVLEGFWRESENDMFIFLMPSLLTHYVWLFPLPRDLSSIKEPSPFSRVKCLHAGDLPRTLYYHLLVSLNSAHSIVNSLLAKVSPNDLVCIYPLHLLRIQLFSENPLFLVSEGKWIRKHKPTISFYSPFPALNVSTYSSHVPGSGTILFILEKW